VAFGTSGHRGSALDAAFNEDHILAISQAICLYRAEHSIDGPLFLGMDTHALSVPARASALEVLAANGVTVMIAGGDEYTPTPVVSHAILTYNRGRKTGVADGIVITPSHNPPHDSGFKYNRPHGGPAEREITAWIQTTANGFLEHGLHGVKRIPFERALRASTTHPHDYLGAYTSDLATVIDMEAIRGAGLSLGVDPLGGAGVHYWGPIAELRLGPHRRQRRRRSDVPLHDRGLGRPDSHGPVLALRDGELDQAEGSLRYRVRLRHRP
jgi:phosphoglucomutase